MLESEELAKKLKALAHPLRLKIVALLAEEGEDKLENAGIVKSRVVLIEGEARALRYYKLLDFDIHISPELLKRRGKEDWTIEP